MAEVLPLPGGIGAAIRGLDFSREIGGSDADTVRSAWIRHGLLLVRDPAAGDEAQMRLSRIFGEMEPSATTFMNDPVNRFMMTLAYDPDDPDPQFAQHYAVAGVERAGWLGWHWDQAFMPTIVRGAVLRMTRPAAAMGRTGFIDAIAAYERILPELQARIAGLEVVYEFNPDFASGQFGFPPNIRALPRKASGGGKASALKFPAVIHPLVITQKETGRKVLKLSPMHARRVLGMDRFESEELLTTLANSLTDEAYAYLHEWQANDMIVWDNWRMIHMAEGVPLDCPRAARRTTIAGDYQFGRYLDAALEQSRDRHRAIERIVD